MEKNLYDVHKAISEAQQENARPDDPLVTFSVKMRESLKGEVEEILQRHGVTPAQFIRKLFEGLVQDYRP